MRRAFDFYPTPSWATKTLLDHVPEVRASRILEPCVGAGDMSAVLWASGCTVLTNDVDRTRQADTYLDARQRESWRAFQIVEWIVSNPAFAFAPKIIPLAFEHATRGVAMFLRLSYLEPCDGRGEWLAEHPPTRQIVLPRVSFTGDGNTDSVTCAWFVWATDGQPLEGPPIVIVPPIAEPRGGLLELLDSPVDAVSV